MIQLIATEQTGTTQIELDIPLTPIELNFQYLDLSDPMSRRSPYSFRFQMPLTKGNNKFFAFYYNANVTNGTFTPNSKTTCTLLSDGILLMQGTLQLYSVSGEGYEVSILESVASVFETIKGTTWQQLFTTDAGTVDTDLDHALNWNNIKDSWDTSNDITTGAVGNGTIVYPIADNGASGNTDSATAVPSVGIFGNADYDLGQTLFSINMKPSIRIAYLIDYIFNKAGFTISSTWLNSADTQKIYMFLALEALRVEGRPSYGFKVGYFQDIVLLSQFSSIWLPIIYSIENVSPFYDPDGLYDDYFIAPFDGTFTLKTTNVVRSDRATAGNYNFAVRIDLNGAEYGQSYTQACAYNVESVVTFETVVEMSAGDSCRPLVMFQSEETITYFQTGANAVTSFELISWDSAASFVDVSQNFPDVPVDEWLKAIIERFNLVIISDQKEPTVMKIEPWSDYWEEGNVNKDWTEIVDQDSIQINSTLEFQKKTFEFTDAEGDDNSNTWWQENIGWIKGKYSYINENDFATENAKTTQVFQPYRNSPVYSNVCSTSPSSMPNVLIPKFWEWNGVVGTFECGKKWVSSKPVLAYYNGMQDIGNGMTWEIDGVDYSQFPYFAEYNTYGVTTTTKSLAWGYDYPDNFLTPAISGGTTGGTTLKYSFYNYWSQLFSEIYSSDARVMTCDININYTELYDLKFNDNLYLDGCFWRVLSISNFAVGGTSLAKAKLIKVINKPIGIGSTTCNAIPDSFETDGTVNFVDSSTGLAVPSTELCCVLNGYVWDNANTSCVSRTASAITGGRGGGGGNGGGGVGGIQPSNIYAKPSNPYNSFPLANVRLFSQRGVNGTNIKTNLQASTTSATPALAKTEAGIDTWLIPTDTVIYIRVQAIAVEIGGTAGVIGNTVTQNTQGTVANTRLTRGAKAIARNVGTTTIIAENKDALGSAVITINSQQAKDGEQAFFTISCTGSANVKSAWFIDLEMTTLQIDSGLDQDDVYPIFYNLDPTEVMFANLLSDDWLIFNKI